MRFRLVCDDDAFYATACQCHMNEKPHACAEQDFTYAPISQQRCTIGEHQWWMHLCMFSCLIWFQTRMVSTPCMYSQATTTHFVNLAATVVSYLVTHPICVFPGPITGACQKKLVLKTIENYHCTLHVPETYVARNL